jgi:DNA polymerase elongation subunit (family B)
MIQNSVNDYPSILSSSPLEKGFYELVEKKDFLKFIPYGDTDSIFLMIPVKNAYKLDMNQKWKIVEKVSEDINLMIKRYMEEWLLPRSNIETKHNTIYFKSEILFGGELFLDVKKMYAYIILNKEGKPIIPPKIKYTGIQVKKSDTPKITKDLLIELIENIALNPKLSKNEKPEKAFKTFNKFQDLYYESIDKNFDIEYVGVPVKYGKNDLYINGFELFNRIFIEKNCDGF